MCIKLLLEKYRRLKSRPSLCVYTREILIIGSLFSKSRLWLCVRWGLITCSKDSISCFLCVCCGILAWKAPHRVRARAFAHISGGDDERCAQWGAIHAQCCATSVFAIAGSCCFFFFLHRAFHTLGSHFFFVPCLRNLVQRHKRADFKQKRSSDLWLCLLYCIQVSKYFLRNREIGPRSWRKQILGPKLEIICVGGFVCSLKYAAHNSSHC